MTPEQFLQLLQQHSREIEQAIHRTLPVKVGAIAKAHFQDNFRQGGFVDGGLHPWQRTHRQQSARGANGQYSPLMSSRQHLYGSISYTPADAAVTVGTSVPYAGIHNDGGDIVVTERMKRFFWAKFHEANGNSWARKQRKRSTSAPARATASCSSTSSRASEIRACKKDLQEKSAGLLEVRKNSGIPALHP